MASPLVDSQIRSFGRAGGIHPYRESQTNPASYNLTIGFGLKVDRPYGWEDIDLSKFSEERPYMVEMGSLILTDVQELVRIPPDMEAQVVLRSSAGRAGWDHANSGYVDPGYQGRLTLEFVNCRNFTRLPIYPGQQLVQLRFHSLDVTPERHYGMTGRYQNALAVEDCKDRSVL
jgi:dCTP deaminase